MYDILEESNYGLGEKSYGTTGLLDLNKSDQIYGESTIKFNNSIDISNKLIVSSIMPTWDRVLSIGINNIDSKHIEIFNYMEKCLYLMKTNFARNKLMKVSIKLEEYVALHLIEEEAIQKQHEYLQYDKHIKQHEKIRKLFSELNILLKEKDVSQESMIKMGENIVKYYRQHILHFDRELGEFLLNKLRK